MTDKRIYDYNVGLAEDPNYFFALDRLNNATGKISYANMGKQITTDIEKARTWLFGKVDENTFYLNTVFTNETGMSFPLEDGQVIHIPQSTTLYPFNWQSNSNPKIKVNSGDAIDVYNGVWYNKYEITGLDGNTFWDKGMYFVYDATLNVLMLYKEDYNSGDFINGDTSQRSGVYKADGSTSNSTKYPVLTQVLAKEGNGETMPNMVDTCLTGFGSVTPLGVITKGSVKNIPLNVDFNGGLEYFEKMYNNDSAITGVYSYTRNPTQPSLFYLYGDVNNPTKQDIYHYASTSISNYNLTLQTGADTLTTRTEYVIGRVL